MFEKPADESDKADLSLCFTCDILLEDRLATDSTIIEESRIGVSEASRNRDYSTHTYSSVNR